MVSSFGALYTFASFIQFIYNMYSDISGDSDASYYEIEEERLLRYSPEYQRLHAGWVKMELFDKVHGKEDSAARQAFEKANGPSLLLGPAIAVSDIEFPYTPLHKVHAVD